MDDDGDSLQITPSFKSRSSKGKGKARVPGASASTPRDSPGPSTSAAPSVEADEGDLDEGSSAILFKRSSKSSKARASGIGASSSLSAAKKQGSASSSRSKLALSFGESEEAQEDEDAEGDEEATSSVKRSEGASRKLKRPPLPPGTAANYDAASRLSSSLSTTSISGTSGPSYSNEYLQELKAGTSARPATSNPQSGYDSLTLSKFGGAMAAEEDVASSGSTMIPTESAIAAAKARRETARRLGVDSAASSDFVSLDVGMPVKNRESRLVREEDEIGEGEDEHAEYTGASERILLGKKGRQKMDNDRREGIRELIDMTMDEEDDGLYAAQEDEDEESRRWEMEQIRRGEQSNRHSNGDEEQAPYTPAQIPEAAAIPSLMSTSNRLAAALADLQSLKSEKDQLLESSSRDLTALDKQEAELRTEVTRVNDKYEWFAEFKNWIEDVAVFLDDKFPKLEKIERDNSSIQKERLDMLSRRRYLDDSDDIALFTGAEVPVQYGTPDAVKDGEDMDVDDMGRSRADTDLQPRSYSRRNRREERRKRQVLRSPGSETHGSAVDDGNSTDDDLLTSDSQDLQAAGESLLQAIQGLFADVESEEYREPSLGIRPRFEDWKHRYGEDYANAFAGLAMVSVWEFWARTEMAAWNPFAVPELPASATSLEQFSWHKALTDYQHARAASVEANGAAGHEQLNPEDDTVNGMVATVLVPRLRRLVLDGYDPYSTTATGRALSTVEEMSYCMETTNPRFESLILAYLSRFQQAILRLQSLVLPHLAEIRSPRSGMDSEAIQARQRFCQRCLKLVSNGMRWRRYAKSFVLPLGGEGEGLGAGSSWEVCLAEQLVKKVMLPCLEAGWDTGGSDIAQKVLKLFPGFTLPDDIARRLKA